MEGEIKTRSYRKMAILSLGAFFIVTLFFFFLKENSEVLSEIEEEKERNLFESNRDCSGYFNGDCFQKISQKIKDRIYSIAKE